MAATENQKIDIRTYIGIIFFRWQVIVLCFLYSLLAAVGYIYWTPKQYLTSYKIMIYSDPNLTIQRASTPWQSFSTHSYLLQSERLRQQAAVKLQKDWLAEVGSVGRMVLPVEIKQERMLGSTLNITVKSTTPLYAEAFLKALYAEHATEWQEIQNLAIKQASEMLETELRHLRDQMMASENDLIEYKRLHDIARVEARGSAESRYLQALMERKSQIQTELMLLEAQYPVLKGAGAGVISSVHQLTRETGTIEAVPEEVERPMLDEAGSSDGAVGGMGVSDKPRLPKELTSDVLPKVANEESGNIQQMKLKLDKIKQKERELAANLKPEHPQYRDILKQIDATEQEMALQSQIEMGKLNDRHKALNIQLGALESAEYKWQAKNLLASQRQSDLRRISAEVSRFERNYNSLYQNLHSMRVSESLKAEHFRVVEPVSTQPNPVWPDPSKIMLVALAIGVGLGFGFAILLQTIDNTVQSIEDVEKDLGLPFLGGVPYWVHGGLEYSVRPIVTEENSIGATEAYRALRTSVLSVLAKANERIVIITSADSREGKTLTTLNLAIMIAQMDKKILLVDMDLRRGRLHKSLGIVKSSGMTDALKDGRPLKEIVQTTRFPGLSFIPCGTSVDNTAELLQVADMQSLFSEMLDVYDYIFIDSSPVLRVTDTVIMATQGVGVVLYIARVGHTPKSMIRYSLDLLKNARIVGLIINSVEMHKISSLYYAYQYPNYAYYSNSYAYGYDYDDKNHGGSRRKVRHPYWRRRLGEMIKSAKRAFGSSQ